MRVSRPTGCTASARHRSSWDWPDHWPARWPTRLSRIARRCWRACPPNARYTTEPPPGSRRRASGDVDSLPRIDAVGMDNVAVGPDNVPHVYAIAPGNAGQRVAVTDGVPHARWRRRPAGHGQPLPGIDAVGIGNAIGRREGLSSGPIARGNLGQGLTPLHDVNRRARRWRSSPHGLRAGQQE